MSLSPQVACPPAWLIVLEEQMAIDDATYWGKVYKIAEIPGIAMKFRVEFLDNVAHRSHRHPNHDEFVTVESGLLEQTIEGEKWILRPGETAVIRRGQAHEARPLVAGTVVLVDLIGDGKDYESEELSFE